MEFSIWPYYFLFPQFAQDAYALFKTRVNFPEGTRLLHFFANFGVTWILTWDYTFCSKLPSPYPNFLGQDFNIKWWSSAYDLTLLSTDKLNIWFKEHPQMVKSIAQDQNAAQFLSSKSKIMDKLAAASLEEEFQVKLRALSEAGHSDESNQEATS
ncbi:Enzymatic polyprotein [Senna tora]|uniref:Enzymatic polyprotein n=1 Tax=Senna tora TaxID=362788 RepID=A0A834XCF5_9FABA|nr:Enzymatic polyprotein [Senna tora]